MTPQQFVARAGASEHTMCHGDHYWLVRRGGTCADCGKVFVGNLKDVQFTHQTPLCANCERRTTPFDGLNGPGFLCDSCGAFVVTDAGLQLESRLNSGRSLAKGYSCARCCNEKSELHMAMPVSGGDQ